MADTTTTTPDFTDAAATAEFLTDAYKRLRDVVSARVSDINNTTYPVLPPTAAILETIRLTVGDGHDTTTTPAPALQTLDTPLGPAGTVDHLLDVVVPSLNGQSVSPRYYGFVTGGVHPVAEAADNVVSALDPNVQVHSAAHSGSTLVEDAALRMLVSLLGLDEDEDEDRDYDDEDDGDDEGDNEVVENPLKWSWSTGARTFTTGATASNIMGLACGREAVISSRLPDEETVSEMGLLAACQEAGIREIQVLTSMGHSSLSKAASIVGLGHRAVKELRLSEAEPWRLDLDAVERELVRGESDGVASIIVVSAGEVNTGRFATSGYEDMARLRKLADRYKAWIHVDGGEFFLLPR